MRSLSIWFPVHVDCPEHPKTIRFARLLKLKVPHAFGHLVLFWRWAVQYSKNGSLEGYSNEDISDAAGYSGDPEKFVSALVNCGVNGPGYVEREPSGTLEVHEFSSYLGVLTNERRRDAERKREKRKEKAATGAGLSESVHRTSAGHPPDVHRVSDVEERRGEEKYVVAPSPDTSGSKPSSGETFSTVAGKAWEAPLDLLDGLATAFPGVSVPAECAKARVWLLANPTKRKTPRGMPKFLNSWMERAQNRGTQGPFDRPRGGMAMPPPQRDPSENARRLAEARAMGERKA